MENLINKGVYKKSDYDELESFASFLKKLTKIINDKQLDEITTSVANTLEDNWKPSSAFLAAIGGNTPIKSENATIIKAKFSEAIQFLHAELKSGISPINLLQLAQKAKNNPEDFNQATQRSLALGLDLATTKLDEDAEAPIKGLSILTDIPASNTSAKFNTIRTKLSHTFRTPTEYSSYAINAVLDIISGFITDSTADWNLLIKLTEDLMRYKTINPNPDQYKSISQLQQKAIDRLNQLNQTNTQITWDDHMLFAYEVAATLKSIIINS